MKATTMHLGFDVKGCIRLLEDVPYNKRDLEWRDLRKKFEGFKKHSIINVSACPTPVEESPGVWVCPGHPNK